MEWKRLFAAATLLALAGCGSGGGDSGTNPTNQAPVVSFTFMPLAVAHDSPVDLTITATDADADPLTITWKVTRGTLVAQNTKKTIMRWTAPTALGADTVTVKVSDGTATRTLVEAIKVGYVLPPTTDAPPLFQKSKSPYIVNFNSANPRLTVNDGTTTTIEAGVEIYVTGTDGFFDVLGELDAHGTVDEPIIIKQNNRGFSCAATNAGRWAGVLASGASAVVDFEYVQLWYPQIGVRLRDSSVGNLKNVSVRCSGTSSVSMEGFGALNASDCEFTDGLGDGVALAAQPDSVRIDGCTISFNNGSGIRVDMDDLTKLLPVIIQYNGIEFNDTHGISLSHASFPQIHFNNFSGNGHDSVSSLYLQSGYPSVANPVLDATCNFWGNTTQAAIDIGIHDSLDQSTIHTRVKSCPWLNSNPLTTTPNCSMSCP